MISMFYFREISKYRPSIFCPNFVSRAFRYLEYDFHSILYTYCWFLWFQNINTGYQYFIWCINLGTWLEYFKLKKMKVTWLRKILTLRYFDFVNCESPAETVSTYVVIVKLSWYFNTYRRCRRAPFDEYKIKYMIQ